MWIREVPLARPTKIGVVLAAVVAASSCGAAPDPGSTQDPGAISVRNCGVDLRFDRAPERAVTLEQSSTETLLALGLGEKMVGTAFPTAEIHPDYRAAYDRIPVLNPNELTAEQLRAAAPDVAVTSFGSNFAKDKVGTREELHELGLPTFVSAVDCPQHEPDQTPFERLFRDYENLGTIFGVPERAAALTAQQRQIINNAEAAVPANPHDEPTVMYLYSMTQGLPYVAGHNGIPSDISRILGVGNAFDDVRDEWPEVAWEEIAKRDPDVIVVGDLSDRGRLGDSAADKIRVLHEHPVVSQLTAVRENRFIEVPGIEMDPTVRSAHTLELVTEGMKSLGLLR